MARTEVKSAIRLRFPCELVFRYLLPIVRAKLAQELVNTHNLNQIQTAKILDVTQPAVHAYLHSKVSPKRPELEECLEKIEVVVEELAEDICMDRLTQVGAMMKVCKLCVQLRRGGPICRIHESFVPALVAEGCSLCLQDLVAEKRRLLEERAILNSVQQAVLLIENSPEFSSLIPEIGTNIVMAKSDADEIGEVVGVQGGIHIVAGKPRSTGPPALGGSSHVANAVLTAMRYDKMVRSAVNVRFDWLIVDICKELRLKISFYDRSEEPHEVKSVDGKTIPWGIDQAIKRIGGIPDVVYDLGDVRKEPMIFIFESDAFALAYLAIRIAREYLERKQKHRITPQEGNMESSQGAVSGYLHGQLTQAKALSESNS